MKSLSQAGPSGKSLSQVGRSEGGPGNHFLKLARVKVGQYTNLLIDILISSCLTANPATALQTGRFEDLSMNPAQMV